jgi:release factor glutamine methyltransferase
MDRITLEIALTTGIKALEEAKIEEAKLDAWYLLEYYFHITRAEYLMYPEREITNLQMKEYESLINTRSNNIPLQHITGEQEFMGLNFMVSPAVLIPRQDTEVLVEEVMKVAQNKDVLDLCTGSSCIITSLAKLCTLNKAVGTDISEEALKIARKNINNHHVNVTLLQGDLFESVRDTFDIIVSNPPYIPTRDIEELMPEVKNHEPYIALDGKEDGLYFYRRIIKESLEYLRSDGQIYFEIGYDQGPSIANLLDDSGYKDVRIIKDLAGLDRVVSARI